MKLLPFVSLFFVLLLANTSMAASYITPEKSEVTDVMTNYNLSGQNNSLQLACEIGQYVSSEYGWNCDIRQLNFTNHAPVYLNVFYPAADNKKGYDAYYGWFGPQKKEVTSFTGKDKAVYYRDWSSDVKAGCRITGVNSFGIVKSYFGNATDEYIIEPIVISEENNTTPPPDVYVSDESHGNEKIVIVGSNNSSVETNKLENSTVNNTVTNSTNTVNNQGIVDTIEQYWFDFSNAHLSNVTFNFLGGK